MAQWVLTLKPDQIPLGLTVSPGVRVADPDLYVTALRIDIAAGPTGPRARTGALQEELRDLAKALGVVVPGAGSREPGDSETEL